MIYCGKAEFGQISRSFASNSGAILLKRSENLTQICFPSLRSVKPDRLLENFCNHAPQAATGFFYLIQWRTVNGEAPGFEA
jgi:hypothetical protein